MRSPSASGVGRTTLYDYFVDRDDLIATMVEAELPGVIDDLITTSSDPERLASDWPTSQFERSSSLQATRYSA